MPSEITVPQPTLSFKKAPNTYLSDIISLNTYEKDTKLDISSPPFCYSDALIFNKATPPISKETKSYIYSFKQLFTDLKIFTNPVEIRQEKAPQPDEEILIPTDTILNLNVVEHRPTYSPIKYTYMLSFEKLRTCRDRPIVDILLIHQTMDSLEDSPSGGNFHPSLIERRIIEKTSFLRRLRKATYPQIIPAPIVSKQQYVPPPPPYFCFENGSKATPANSVNQDDDDVPLGVIQSCLQQANDNTN